MTFKFRWHVKTNITKINNYRDYVNLNAINFEGYYYMD